MGFHAPIYDIKELPKTGNPKDILCLVIDKGVDGNGPILETSFLYWYSGSEYWDHDSYRPNRLPPVDFNDPDTLGWFWVYEQEIQ